MLAETSPQNYSRHLHYHKPMADKQNKQLVMTADQKKRRYELENSQKALTPGERVLLAALNDLREADLNGRDLDLAVAAVVQAEKAVVEEGRTPEEVAEDEKENKGVHTHDVEVGGGENVRRVQNNLEEPVTVTQEVKTEKKK